MISRPTVYNLKPLKLGPKKAPSDGLFNQLLYTPLTEFT